MSNIPHLFCGLQTPEMLRMMKVRAMGEVEREQDNTEDYTGKGTEVK